VDVKFVKPVVAKAEEVTEEPPKLLSLKKKLVQKQLREILMQF
jgi:protein TonB